MLNPRPWGQIDAVGRRGQRLAVAGVTHGYGFCVKVFRVSGSGFEVQVERFMASKAGSLGCRALGLSSGWPRATHKRSRTLFGLGLSDAWRAFALALALDGGGQV